jgi:hypothetical protein
MYIQKGFDPDTIHSLIGEKSFSFEVWIWACCISRFDT